MTSLVVATTNLGKLRDFAAASNGCVCLVPLPGLTSIAAPDEDAMTFGGNAKIKAIYYSRFAAEEIVIADDSGLEVDALNGAPGVRSARYADDCGWPAGNGLTADERNNLCLIEALGDVPDGKRQARYCCALAAARDGEILAIGTGAVEGRILVKAQGSGGFGYDPFFLPSGETKSMAELDMQARMALSHRGRSLSDLLLKLTDAGFAFTA